MTTLDWKQVVNNIATTIEFITPEMAAEWLQRLHKEQRAVIKTHVLQLVQNMRSGQFRLSPDSIVILADGSIGNGQHRLNAIVKSGLGQWMMVSRGWDPGVYRVMDQQRKRSLASLSPADWMKHAYKIAAVRIALAGVSVYRLHVLSPQTAIAWAITREDVIDPVMMMPHASRVRAPVLAVCLRASLHDADPERIARFLAVVNTGVAKDESESAAVRLFAWLKSGMRLNQKSGSTGQIEVYQRAQGALVAFLEGRQVATLRGREVEVWPLPTSDQEFLNLSINGSVDEQ